MKFITPLVLLIAFSLPLQARDFENNYAVYGAGAEPCNLYLRAMQSGGKELDFFVDWSVGYLSGFNVIMPNTYNVMGETSFPEVQEWLQQHCQKYPNELFINAMIKLTGVLYPNRYQSSLKPSAKPGAAKKPSR